MEEWGDAWLRGRAAASHCNVSLKACPVNKRPLASIVDALNQEFGSYATASAKTQAQVGKCPEYCLLGVSRRRMEGCVVVVGSEHSAYGSTPHL